MIPTYKVLTRADRFAEIKQRVGVYAEQLVETHTKGAVAQMKELAPYKTGRLRDGIEPASVEKKTGFGVTMGITIEAPYWPYVNYGTVYMEARPFVEPALRQAYEALMRDVANIESALR
jgi:HK97 gp10 family phage protein